MPQRTLALIKPSLIKRGVEGEVFGWYRETGLLIRSVKIIYAKRIWWEEFYKEHLGKPFFLELIRFMTSGLSLALVMEGENAVTVIRELNGATDPREAAEGTLRATFTPYPECQLPNNGVHGSASVKDAERELGLVSRHLEY